MHLNQKCSRSNILIGLESVWMASIPYIKGKYLKMNDLFVDYFSWR